MENTKKFKIINAGLPKTASKSCTLALETLGYTISDIPETYSHFLPVWWDYITGEKQISDVIKEIDSLEFNAVQDQPSNVYWEELYRNIPDSKVG